MRRPENLEMKAEQFCEDNIYANTCDLEVQRIRNTPKAKEIPAARSTKYWSILTLGVLLTLAFIALVILTSFLFIYYKSIKEEMSHLKNSDTNIEDAISQLKSKDTNIEDAISQLKSKDTNIEDAISQLKSKDSNIEDAISQLKSKDRNIEDAISQLKSKDKNIEDAISQLKSKENIQDSCTSCPSGWQLIKSNCYYFQAKEETWTRSREECDSRKGVMLILKDKAELDSLLPTIESGTYWIGLRRDSGNINHWLWADGSSLSFSPWYAGEPNNHKGNEHCAEIVGKVQSMNDRNCEDKRGYICEKAWTC
ncbi:uncharacterized protein [Aquarana catesbeiana]|uniref:uncharacterized protein isoform X2 n=1 Tax=Aquarana catesbeiana TaxID=8400 RepID=UPI003CC97203